MHPRRPFQMARAALRSWQQRLILMEFGSGYISAGEEDVSIRNRPDNTTRSPLHDDPTRPPEPQPPKPRATGFGPSLHIEHSPSACSAPKREIQPSANGRIPAAPSTPKTREALSNYGGCNAEEGGLRADQASRAVCERRGNKRAYFTCKGPTRPRGPENGGGQQEFSLC